MRRFFADPDRFEGAKVTLSADETHHLRDVLRLSPGEDILVFDGAGKEFRCRVLSIAKSGAALDVLEETRPAAPESPLLLTLAPTILNGERYDLIVQKAVELGVTHLVPMQTRRGEVKAADARRRIDRWKRIAMEATKQCGRARLMTIGEPVTFDDLIRTVSPESTILFSEREGAGLPQMDDAESLTALFGPKGGWEDEELETAKGLGVSIVTLGGRILRAETAAISLTTILQHRFGDLN